MGNEPRRYDLVTSVAQHFLPFALHGQHLNGRQVLKSGIQTGNGNFVRDSARSGFKAHAATSPNSLEFVLIKSGIFAALGERKVDQHTRMSIPQEALIAALRMGEDGLANYFAFNWSCSVSVRHP
jgi:hypothetical protein